jgi:hypothetical protein
MLRWKAAKRFQQQLTYSKGMSKELIYTKGKNKGKGLGIPGRKTEQ